MLHLVDLFNTLDTTAGIPSGVQPHHGCAVWSVEADSSPNTS